LLEARKEQKKFEKEVKKGKIGEDVSVCEVLVGNTHESVGSNHHKWKIYVEKKEESKYEIEKVEFRLHPTFQPAAIVVEEEPFELERVGWGTFKVQVIVHWDNGKKSILKHHLSFSQPKTEKKHVVREE